MNVSSNWMDCQKYAKEPPQYIPAKGQAPVSLDRTKLHKLFEIQKSFFLYVFGDLGPLPIIIHHNANTSLIIWKYMSLDTNKLKIHPIGMATFKKLLCLFLLDILFFVTTLEGRSLITYYLQSTTHQRRIKTIFYRPFPQTRVVKRV